MNRAEEVQDFRLAEAYHQGRTAGRLGLAFSLNPFKEGSEEAKQWIKGRESAIVENLNRYADKAIIVTALLCIPFAWLIGV
jgi:hypothetical protein